MLLLNNFQGGDNWGPYGSDLVTQEYNQHCRRYQIFQTSFRTQQKISLTQSFWQKQETKNPSLSQHPRHPKTTLKTMSYTHIIIMSSFQFDIAIS